MPSSTSQHVRSAGRMVVPAVALLVLLALLVLSPTVAGSSGSAASAYVAAAAGQITGQIDVGGAATDNTTTAAAASLPGVSLSSGSAGGSSFVNGQSLISTATVTAGGVDLLGGIVTAGSVQIQAVATASRAGATISTSGSSVTVTHIEGVPDTDIPSQGTIDVPGIGTLTILGVTSEASGGSSSAQITGLSLEVTTPTNGFPAGTYVVGSISVRADQSTLDGLVGTPTPTPSPSRTRTHSPSPRPSPSPTRSTSPTPTATYPTTTYSPMPAPATPSSDALSRFPGAVFPVVGTYTYTDTFGAPRANTPQGHQGADIFASYGSPVVAVQDGTLTTSTYGIGGNNLHLTNAGGDYFYYAHLSRFATGLQEGQHVVAGQTIGYVGTTGDAQGTPPHLHFEIHPGGGAAVDPTPYLDAWRSAGHVVTTGATGQGTTQSGSAPQHDPQRSGDAASALVQQVAEQFAALQAGITTGRSNVPGHGGIDPIGAVFVVVNTAGALVIKRLQLGAALLLL